MGGKLALSYAGLIKDMWLSNSGTADPYEFKKILGKSVTKFSSSFG